MAHRPAGGLTGEEARETTRRVLAAHGVIGPDLEDALLVVTELVSNARRHAGGVTAFRIRCRPPRAAVEVSDADQGVPVHCPAAAGAPGCFGWLMVNRLAEHVTVETGPSGKTITVVVAARTDVETPTALHGPPR
ncbi:ATP-binding protein [Streptomyces sp. NPDC004050]